MTEQVRNLDLLHTKQVAVAREHQIVMQKDINESRCQINLPHAHADGSSERVKFVQAPSVVHGQVAVHVLGVHKLNDHNNPAT